MQFLKRIYNFNVPSSYPKRFDTQMKNWAEKQPFPIWEPPILKKVFDDEGFEHEITAMPMGLWKQRDYKVKKGEKALFWLGNVPWWTNRQVKHVDGFAFWGDKKDYAYSKGEIEAGGYGSDWEYDAGDAMGGPFY